MNQASHASKTDGPLSFGLWLRRRRKALDLAQTELARRAGCALITIRKLETDELKPSKELALALAEQLQISPYERDAFVQFARGKTTMFAQTDAAPPWQSAARRDNNLPHSLTTFVGRTHQVAEIATLLESARLVTLLGAGGAGKSRLALRVAGQVLDAFQDGVWLVELASLAEPSLVPQLIARTLQLGEEGAHAPVRALTEYLQARQLLLVLDNCEHLIEATARLAEMLLRAAPQLKILATSREALGLVGEVNYFVPMLSCPAPTALLAVEALARYESIQLFNERARAVQSTFDLTATNATALAQICTRLDGMPLAIELAAARVKVLSVEQIAARLDDRFKLLGSSRVNLPHHQTLRAAIEWSYDLLSAPERVLLRRLGAFVGVWSLEAAEAVCAGEGLDAADILGLLAQLVNKSLVMTEPRLRETRYRTLETIRQFAYEKLREAGEPDLMRTRHRQYYFQLIAQAELKLHSGEGSEWLDRVEAEYENVRAALEWSVASGALREAMQAALQLWGFWVPRSMLFEGREWNARILALYQDEDAFKLGGLQQAITFGRMSGDTAQRPAHLQQARALAETLDNKPGMAQILMETALFERDRGKDEQALVLLAQAAQIYQELNDWGQIEAHYWMAHIQVGHAELAQARHHWEVGLAQARRMENPFHIGWGLGGLAMQARYEGDLKQAAAYSRESLAVKWQYQDKSGIAFSLEELAMIATAAGKLERAARLWGAAERYRELIHSVVPPLHRAEHESHIAPARAALDVALFERAWAEGRAMSIEQAITYAREDD